jgi:hypothetical protein
MLCDHECTFLLEIIIVAERFQNVVSGWLSRVKAGLQPGSEAGMKALLPQNWQINP